MSSEINRDLTIAYLANQFPAHVEPYVSAEIQELRKRGITVFPCSAERGSHRDARISDEEILTLQPLRFTVLLAASFLLITRLGIITDLLNRVLMGGSETWGTRLRALTHTFLGACYAVLLRYRHVLHIHVHHGYYSAWIAMVAARLLGVTYSMTLHGSDLLVHARYLDAKLANCLFCVTISDFNRDYLLEQYPKVEPEKVLVQRLGVTIPAYFPSYRRTSKRPAINLLSVGRLHWIKDHAFLIRCCKRLKDEGLNFTCAIAGEGPERPKLERLIADLGLIEQVKLLGHLTTNALDHAYEHADLVVLTSRSEGIPVVLMEAMSRARVVLAPAITGIPELVFEGETGFLYKPDSEEAFVERLSDIAAHLNDLDHVRRNARKFVSNHFNAHKNTAAFCDLLLDRIRTVAREDFHAHPILQ